VTPVVEKEKVGIQTQLPTKKRSNGRMAPRGAQEARQKSGEKPGEIRFDDKEAANAAAQHHR